MNQWAYNKTMSLFIASYTRHEADLCGTKEFFYETT